LHHIHRSCPAAAAAAQARIESSLLAALDGESESSTASQLRSTLTALLAASAPRQPGYWLKLLGAVALAAPPPANAGQAAAAGAADGITQQHQANVSVGLMRHMAAVDP
jgi:hypothetical protein